MRGSDWRGGGGGSRSGAGTPRLAVRRFLAGGDLALKASVGRYAQFVHSIRDEEVPLGIDFWVTTGSRPPPRGVGPAPGGARGFPGRGMVPLRRCLPPGLRGGGDPEPGERPERSRRRLPRRDGDGRGGRRLLERDHGRIQGSLSLSFLKADRTFPDVLSGQFPRGEVTYPPALRPAPRRGPRPPLSPGAWVGRGAPVACGHRAPLHAARGQLPRLRPAADPRRAPPVAVRTRTGGRRCERGDPRRSSWAPETPSATRLYHRLDLSARRTFVSGAGARITPYLNVLNVYNQPNVLFYFYDYDDVPATRSGLTMFPLLPTVGVELRFLIGGWNAVPGARGSLLALAGLPGRVRDGRSRWTEPEHPGGCRDLPPGDRRGARRRGPPPPDRARVTPVPLAQVVRVRGPDGELATFEGASLASCVEGLVPPEFDGACLRLEADRPPADLIRPGGRTTAEVLFPGGSGSRGA
jgi:hypothetical protein